MGASITESQWADICKNWLEWFSKEELPLGGKCKIWALPYWDVFELAFFTHDVLCLSRGTALNGWTLEEADELLGKALHNLRRKKIIWPKRAKDGSVIEGLIVDREPWAYAYETGRAHCFLMLIKAYR